MSMKLRLSIIQGILAALSIIAVMVIVIYMVSGLISQHSKELYEEKLGKVIARISDENQVLIDAGLDGVQAYMSQARSDLLAVFSESYYRNFSADVYMFITDEGGRALLHPSLPAGTTILKDTASFADLRGQLKAKIGKDEYLLTYRTFSPWGWKVFYAQEQSSRRQPLNRFLTALFLVFLLTIIISVALNYLSVGKMLEPLNSLVIATQNIAKGDFSEQLDLGPNRDGELVELAESFNRMINELNSLYSHLEKSEERYRLLAENARDVIWIIGMDLKSVYVSPSVFRFRGVTTDQALKQELHDVLTPPSMKKVMQLHNQLMRQIKDDPLAPVDIPPIEVEFYHQDGNTVWGELVLNVLRDDDGRPEAILGSTRDITERVKAERDAQEVQIKMIQTDKMASMGLMVSGLAHDINNPNNTIIFNLRRLEKTITDAVPILDAHHEASGDFNLGGVSYSKLRRLLPRILGNSISASEMIQEIIQNLKDFVALGSDALSAPIDLNNSVRRAILLLEIQVRERTGQITTNLDSELPSIKGNAQNMVQICLNLVANALESLTMDGGKVAVRTYLDMDMGAVVLEVTDNGKGMDPDMLTRATEAFYTTKGDQGGTGLGLHITKTLVEEHGGELELTSAAGKGTTAKISFPAMHRYVNPGNPEKEEGSK